MCLNGLGVEMEQCLFLLLLVLAFLVRTVFQLTPGSDSPVHYWRLSKVAKGKGRIDHAIDDAVVGSRQAYPKLNHFLVSRFPARYWPIIGNVINGGLDCLLALMLLLLAGYYFEDLVSNNSLGVFLIISIFLFSPVLLPIDARMKGVNGRVIGGFFATLYLLSLFAAQHESLWFLLLAALWGNLAIASSQFALQVVFSFSLLMSIFFTHLYPLAGLMLTLIFSALFKPLGNLDVLRFWLIHKRWYLRSMKSVEIVASKNRLTDLIALPRLLVTNPKRFFFVALFQQSLVLLVLSAFVYFVFGWLAVFKVGIENLSPLGQFASGIAAASLVMFLITFRGWLAVIGEPERYLEYSLFFLCVGMLDVVSMSDTISHYGLLAILLAQCCIVFLNLVVSLDPRKLFSVEMALPSYARDISALFTEEENPRQKNLAVVPVKTAMPLSYALSIQGVSGVNYFYRHMEDGSSDFEYMHDVLGGEVNDHLGLRWGTGASSKSSEVFAIEGEELLRRYNITHIVIEADYKARLAPQWVEGLRSHFELVLSTQLVDVYRVLPRFQK